MKTGKFLIETHLSVNAVQRECLSIIPRDRPWHLTAKADVSQTALMAERGTMLWCPRKGQMFLVSFVPLPRSGVAAPGLSQLGFEPLLIRVGSISVGFAYLIDKCAHKVNETHLKLWKLSSFPSVHHGLWEDANSPWFMRTFNWKTHLCFLPKSSFLWQPGRAVMLS